MANCRYILGEKTFNSEIELDDYLSEIKSLYKKYGDEVFSRKWSPIQLTYRERIFSLKEQLDEAIKSGRIKIESSLMEDEDLDGIIDTFDVKGVSSLIKKLRSLNDTQVFPEFDRTEYWKHVRADLKAGNFGPDSKIKSDYIPYIFDEKDDDGNYITHPIDSEEEFQLIKDRIEKMWKLLGLIGSVTHDIFDIFYSKYTDDNGTDIRKLPKELYREKIKELLKSESRAYKELLKFMDIAKNTSFIDSVIENAQKFNEDLKKLFDPKNEGLMILPEITIRGAAVLGNENFKVVGRLDMLVIKPDGEIHIIDYKCSPREYINYDTAKKLTFKYLLAVYRRILLQLGVNTKNNIRLWVVPIQFTNFEIDKSDDTILLDGIKLREGATFEELDVSRPTMNSLLYETVENNLDNSFKSDYVEDVTADKILTKTRNWLAKVFPEYSEMNEGGDEYIRKYLDRRKAIVKLEDSGKWGFRRYKNSDIEFISDTEEEVVNKVKQEWVQNKNRNLERVKDVKKALKEAREQNLGRSAMFRITNGKYKDSKAAKTPDWALQVLQRYSNKNWTIVDAPEALESLGMILVRNRDRIDVIKLSHTYDLDAKIKYGNNRTTLFGNFVSDHVANSQPNSLVVQSTRGNIELMEAMYALNCMPSLFNNLNAFLGEIQLISPYNEGGGMNNESLLYNFLKLIQYSNTEESPEVSYFDDKVIRMASFVQLASDTLHRILYENEDNRRWSSLRECSSNLDKAMGNKEDMLNLLYTLKKELENNFPSLSENGVTISIYDDYNSPEKRLYAEVMLAIGQIGGLKYTLLLKDHARIYEGKSLVKAFLWDGFNGNLTDNPGTLRSETLNLASHLVDVAYQNIRDQLTSYKGSLDEALDELKAEKGVLNLSTLYDNFYDTTVLNELIFKNPFTNPELSNTERKVLLKLLLDITKRRKPSITTLEQLEVEISNNPTTLLVPLISRSGKPVSKTLGESIGTLRKFIINLNPKNIFSNFKEKLQESVLDEETREGSIENIWQLTNEIDASKDVRYRKEYILRKGGIDKFEKNLEVLALKHEYAYIQKNEVDKIMPFLKALTIHLANQGIILNDNFENDISYIQNFIKSKILNKTLLNIEAIDKKAVLQIMKYTSVMALAFNPKMLYLFIDGIWKDIRIVLLHSWDQDTNLTLKNFKDSFFWIMLDIWRAGGDLSVGEGLNQLYGINDMDINLLPSRYAKETYGTDRLQKAMFRFASRPDYYNRMTIFGALMRGDGCFEAHSIVDGKLVYDWTKDKRFDVFAKAKGDINKVSANEKLKFILQQSLYYTMAYEMVKDGTLNPDGSKFVLDMKHPMALPKAYTVRQSESMKALGDKTYGYYASEKKSLIQSFTMGAIIFQMNTFWSSKKNLFFSGRGYTLEGRYVDYVEENPNDPDHPIKYYLKYNESTGEMDIVTEDTGIPFKVWKGNPQEGIILTLSHMFFDAVTGRRDYEGQKFWDIYWNNDDLYLRKMFRANLILFLVDLFGMLFIGQLVAPSLVNSANDYAKLTGSDTIGDAAIGYSALLGANMFATSTDDFYFIKSVFGRGVQWTPFSALSGYRSIVGISKCVFGDVDFYDTMVNQMSFTRNAKPIMNYVKVHSLGREVGDNGKEE